MKTRHAIENSFNYHLKRAGIFIQERVPADGMIHSYSPAGDRTGQRTIWAICYPENPLRGRAGDRRTGRTLDIGCGYHEGRRV